MQGKQRIILRVGDGRGMCQRAAQVPRAGARPARQCHAADGAAALVRQRHPDYGRAAAAAAAFRGAAAPLLDNKG